MAFFQKLFGREDSNASRNASNTSKEWEHTQNGRKPPFTMWLAINGSSKEAICEQLNLLEPAPCNWEEGVKRSTSTVGVLYISDDVGGWHFICGNALPDLGYRSRALTWLCSLEVPEVCYFAAHKEAMMHYFARITGGHAQRVYACVQGEVKLNRGERSEAEKKLSYKFPEDTDELFEAGFEGGPGEEEILNIAAEWSVDPSTAKINPKSMGIIGIFQKF